MRRAEGGEVRRIAYTCAVSFLIVTAFFVSSAQAAGTKYIRDNATGGDCASIASWNNTTKTCTLTGDLPLTNLVISNNGITVDGAGHLLSGSGSLRGVDLSGRSNVNVINLSISSFSHGIYANGGANNAAVNNYITGNNQGIYFKSVNGGQLTGNVASNIWKGIALDLSQNITVSSNTVNGNTLGISVTGSAGVMLGNAISGNSLSSNQDSVFLSNASGNLISGNTSTGSANSGINLASSASNNTVTGNTVSGGLDGIVLNSYSNGNSVLLNIISGNSGKGINMNASSWNSVAYNEITGNGTGFGAALYASSNNLVYNNSFRNNGTQLYAITGTGNVFNQPAPVGGNYFDNFDTPAEGCNDINADHFCDSPFVYGFVQDNLPWTSAGSWCDKPALSLSLPQAFWASYDDYILRQLSVNWTIRDNGLPAYDVKLTRSDTNNGVTLLTDLPVSFGDISPGGSSTQTLKYHVPPAVTSWRSINGASASDACGTTYAYP